MKTSQKPPTTSGEPGKIPGNVLAMDIKKPFTQLKQFGGTFLTRSAEQYMIVATITTPVSRFECSTTKSSLLQSLYMLDTPGINPGTAPSTTH